MSKLAPCIVCPEKTAPFWFKKNDCDLYRCGECGLILTHPIPSQLEDIYQSDYFKGASTGFGYSDYEAIKEINNETFLKFLGHIEVQRPEKGKILDVGAATGTFLETARTRGWEVEGIEISDYAAEVGNKKGLNIHQGTLHSVALVNGSYDAITLWDVFEHIHNPIESLEKIKSLLKPGGLLVMNLPDAGSFYARMTGKWWPLIVPPEHLYLYTQKSLRKLFAQMGMETIKTARVGKRFNPSYILQVLYTVRYQKIWETLANLVKKTPLDRLKIPLPLRDNLFIIARVLPEHPKR
jgi:2-polyprenyl-3-methyl-5-hydroxy-6-metoxy-1,4-benzoquinol methylase